MIDYSLKDSSYHAISGHFQNLPVQFFIIKLNTCQIWLLSFHNHHLRLLKGSLERWANQLWHWQRWKQLIKVLDIVLSASNEQQLWQELQLLLFARITDSSNNPPNKFLAFLAVLRICCDKHPNQEVLVKFMGCQRH